MQQEKTLDSVFDEKKEDIWKAYAPAYARVLPEISFYSDMVESIVSKVQGKRVLDIGCGPGIITEKLVQEGYKVVAVDNNAAMISYAQRNLAEYPNATVQQADAHQLPFPSNYFDSVVASNVLCHVEDPNEMLREAYHVLKSKGKIILSGPKPGFDVGVLNKKMEQDLDNKGLTEMLAAEIKVIKEVNAMFKDKLPTHFFSHSDLQSMLGTRHDFGVLGATDCYLSQSYLVVGQK